MTALAPEAKAQSFVTKEHTTTSVSETDGKTVTPVWTVDSSADLASIERVVADAANLLREGHVVGFPTETVYGLGGNALLTSALDKIFHAKGRPSDNPLIVHVATMQQCRDIVEYIPPVAEKLAQAFWPGPLTLVLRKKNVVSERATAGLDTVAVRMPNHPVALALIRLSGVPIAAPSANLSGKPSPTSAEHVIADLSGRIAGIVDGGHTGVGLESTVVDCSPYPRSASDSSSPSNSSPTSLSVSSSSSASTASPSSSSSSLPAQSRDALSATDPPLVILRPGGVTKEDLETVVGVGRVSVQGHAWSNGSGGENIPKAPGMKYVHYAPRAPVMLVDGSDRYIQSLIDASRAEKKKVGMLTTEEKRDLFRAEHIVLCGRRDDMATVARKLYDALRAFDDTDVDIIYGEIFPEVGLGSAVMNRLDKAAGQHFIREADTVTGLNVQPAP